MSKSILLKTSDPPPGFNLLPLPVVTPEEANKDFIHTGIVTLGNSDLEEGRGDTLVNKVDDVE